MNVSECSGGFGLLNCREIRRFREGGCGVSSDPSGLSVHVVLPHIRDARLRRGVREVAELCLSR